MPTIKLRDLYWSFARMIWLCHRIAWKAIDGVSRQIKRPEFDEHGMPKMLYRDIVIDWLVILLLAIHDNVFARFRKRPPGSGDAHEQPH